MQIPSTLKLLSAQAEPAAQICGNASPCKDCLLIWKWLPTYWNC